MWGENYQWHFDYARLASDAGFYFERHKAHNFDKAKICMIDVERVISDRDIDTVERCIPTVVKFVLDREQAELLDTSFVRTFRITQLSVEYLLFCKKYLDNTVVQLKEELQKLKEENDELKTFVEELKAHIGTLMARIQEQAAAAYRCNVCSKAFSTEEFLMSHKKRRHSGVYLGSEAAVQETDKLHMEIKELKGRINNAEKLMQSSSQENISVHNNVAAAAPVNREVLCAKENDLKILELQQRFEALKTQVEIELRSLQYHQNLEDKCGKWFGYALQGAKLQEKEEVEKNEKDGEKNKARGPTAQSAATTSEVTSEDDELRNAQKQMSRFSEDLEAKVTSSLQKIEEQMESFWKKLNEMEASNRSSKLDKHSPEAIAKKYYLQNVPSSETSDEHNRLHPPAKLRSRYTLMQAETEFQEVPERIKDSYETDKRDKNSKNDRSDKNDRSRKKVRISDRKQKKPYSRMVGGDSEPESEIDSKTDSRMDSRAAAAAIVPEGAPKRPATAPPRPKPRKSKIAESKHREPETVHEKKSPEKGAKVRKKKRRKTVDVKQNEEQENSRIETVSPAKKSWWKEKSSEEETITENLEASDIQKSSDKEQDKATSPTLIQNFEKEVERALHHRMQAIGVSPEWKGLPDRSYEKALAIVNHQAGLLKKTIPNFDSFAKQIKKKVAKKVDNAESENPDQPARIKSAVKKKKVEIKHRSLYATDSEDENPEERKTRMLEELRLVTRIRNVDPIKVDPRKPKKKVLFDLSDQNAEGKAKDGGSTTSLASSVLDGTPRNPQNALPRKSKDSPKKAAKVSKSKVEEGHGRDIEDLSDYEFSDM